MIARSYSPTTANLFFAMFILMVRVVVQERGVASYLESGRTWKRRTTLTCCRECRSPPFRGRPLQVLLATRTQTVRIRPAEVRELHNGRARRTILPFVVNRSLRGRYSEVRIDCVVRQLFAHW